MGSARLAGDDLVCDPGSKAPVSFADTAARIAALEASLARANAALAARDLLIGTLRGQITRLRRMQFGACTCLDCGGTLRRPGVDAHEMLDIVPVRWRVLRQVRPKYSCRRREKII